MHEAFQYLQCLQQLIIMYLMKLPNSSWMQLVAFKATSGARIWEKA